MQRRPLHIHTLSSPNAAESAPRASRPRPSLRNPWVHRHESHASTRLFCFPFAGGSATAFHGWRSRLSAHDIEVCAVQPPGREERLGEPLFDRMAALVPALADAVEPLMDRPFAFFGHSLGALVAYELCRELVRRGRALPLHLFASAHRAPHLRRSRPALHALPDEQFRAGLRALRGTPPSVLDNPELSRMFFPILRADLALTDNYVIDRADPIDCPITALAGTHDPLVDEPEVAAWERCTRRDFRLMVLPGGHFFVREQEAAVLALLVEAMQRLSYPAEAVAL